MIRARRVYATLLGIKQRRKKLPRQQQPDMVRVDYARAVTLPVARMTAALVRERIFPRLHDIVQSAAAARRRDAGDDDINDVLDAISSEVFSQFTNERLRAEAQRYAARTSDFQREQLQRQFRSALGIDLRKSEPWLEQRTREWTQQNVALIKSIPRDQLAEVHDVIFSGLREGSTVADIAESLQERFDIAENRAQLIANDQVGKFFGELNSERQQQLGVERYIWRGMLDSRERDEHIAREGETFAWDDPPEDGNPGEPVNCRCYGEPDLTDLLDGE